MNSREGARNARKPRAPIALTMSACSMDALVLYRTRVVALPHAARLVARQFGEDARVIDGFERHGSLTFTTARLFSFSWHGAKFRNAKFRRIMSSPQRDRHSGRTFDRRHPSAHTLPRPCSERGSSAHNYY